jgi:putative toxin-antitoxin system antitoxin component (TIGR02293 family)
MAHLGGDQTPVAEVGEIQRVAELLGGARILRRHVRNSLDAHELLLEGLPGRALTHLIDRLVIIGWATSLEKAVGISLRTLQRRKNAPAEPLSQEQSGRTWKFAEILAKATAVLGSQEEAEQWLEQPAIGLDQRRPIDLLATPAGVEMVEDFLERLEYGVYM